MSFQDSTRRKLIPLTAQAKGATAPLQWDIPKTGLLAAIHVNIAAAVAGSLSAPNIYGFSSIVRRVRVVTNAGIDLINITGPGYFYLLQNMLEGYQIATPQNVGGTAITAISCNLDMVLPIALNARDPIGLFMLQNEQTLVQLQVEFEDDATVATGATVTATVTPAIEVFTVPVDTTDWPPLNVVQQTLEDTRAITAVGDYDYSWPRGNTYIQVAHGYGCLATPAEHWSRARLIVNQSETLMDYTPGQMALEWNRSHGRARGLGVVLFDLIGTSALGTLGSSRDLMYSAAVTELLSRITIAAQPHTLRTIRRQLVSLR